MHPHLGCRSSAWSVALIGLLSFAAAGCAGDEASAPDDSAPASLKWVLGPTTPEQTLRAEVAGLDPVSTALTNSIVVRVVGINNTPIVGVPVAFQITAGAGVITPQSALTNAFGEVNVKWTLGPTAGANTLLATVANLAPAVISATATP